MTSFVHPTAIVDPSAKIGEGNWIGPYCLIGPGVQIGSNNRFEAFVSIGTPAEHRDYFLRPPGLVRIGNNCIVREYVTINGGTTKTTCLGNQVVVLRGSYVAHDVTIRDNANISCNVMIGGHTVIGHGANLGLAAVVHQNRVIGAYAMIGMNSTVTRNMLPFLISFGSPCKLKRVNRVGLDRAGVLPKQQKIFEDWFLEIRHGFRSQIPLSHPFQSFLRDYLEDTQKFEQKNAVA